MDRINFFFYQIQWQFFFLWTTNAITSFRKSRAFLCYFFLSENDDDVSLLLPLYYVQLDSSYCTYCVWWLANEWFFFLSRLLSVKSTSLLLNHKILRRWTSIDLNYLLRLWRGLFFSGATFLFQWHAAKSRNCFPFHVISIHGKCPCFSERGTTFSHYYVCFHTVMWYNQSYNSDLLVLSRSHSIGWKKSKIRK